MVHPGARAFHLTMKQLTASDLDLLRRLESCALTADQLPHRAHLRLAFIHLSLYPFDVALATLRRRLQRFLAHHGAPHSAYHETLTHAWLLAVRHFMQATPSATSSEKFLLRCPRLLDKKIMATHYTETLLMSPAARAGFVEPDREPIPRHADDRGVIS
jgi:hypothetical protein